MWSRRPFLTALVRESGDNLDMSHDRHADLLDSRQRKKILRCTGLVFCRCTSLLSLPVGYDATRAVRAIETPASGPEAGVFHISPYFIGVSRVLCVDDWRCEAASDRLRHLHQALL